MMLKVRLLEFEAEKPIIILNKEDAEDLNVRPLDRIELCAARQRMICIVNIADRFILPGEIGVYDKVQEELGLKWAQKVSINRSDPPESIDAIRKKLRGNSLKYAEVRQIIKDVVDNKLSDIEITSFVISLYNHGMSMDEAAYLSRAMMVTGKTLGLKKKRIFDKHSIGGIPGDKTTMLLVPTVAAAGLTIPKTSSRAITAPAGSADRIECLCPVEFEVEEMRRIVNKVNGCMVWGGSLDLAPADDKFIEIEYVLSIDPLLLASILSKKKSVNAKYVAIDIPTGRGVKVPTVRAATELSNKFVELGKKLGMNVSCVSTIGNQPIGYSVGPALEAREALKTLIKGSGPPDLIDKTASLSAILFSFAGMSSPRKKALQIIRSGKAEKKLREIIEAQGGDPKIMPEDIPVGPKSVKIKSSISGRVWWINNSMITEISRDAGTPKDKGAGIHLRKKLGDKVSRGDTVLEIYAEKGYKLNRALSTAGERNIMDIGRKRGIVLAKTSSKKARKKFFILER